MVSSEIIAHECFATLTTPLLPLFLAVVKKQSDAWADQTIAQLQARLGDEVPVTWDVRITSRDALAVHAALSRAGQSMLLGDLLRDSTDRERMLAGCVLMRVRANETVVLPPEESDVQIGDACLFAGTAEARAIQELTLRNANVLEYVRAGREVPVSWIWRRIANGKRALAS